MNENIHLWIVEEVEFVHGLRTTKINNEYDIKSKVSYTFYS